MNDETNRPSQPGATPNRDRPREAPVIDARPGDVREVKPADAPGAGANPAGPAAKPSTPTAGAPQPASAKPAGAAAGEARAPDTKSVDTRSVDSKSVDTKAAAEKTGPAKAPEKANPASGTQRRGYGAMAGAGLAGAILALAGAWGLGLSGGSAIQPLDTRIKAMESAQARHTAALEAAQKAMAAYADMEQRITGLEAALKQQAALAHTLKADVGKLAAGPGVAAPDLRPVEARIAALEKLMGDAKSSVRATDEPQVKPAQGAAGETIARLQSRLAELERKIRPPADLAPLGARVAELEKRIAPLENRIASAIAPVTQALEKSHASIAGNAKAIAQTEQKITVGIARSNAAARAIVARALLERVQSGAPFADELAAVVATGGNPEHVAVLQPFAEKGAPSRRTLLAAFNALEKVIVQAPAPAADAPVLERLKQGAFSLVKIRPVDSTQGETPGALFVRIRNALASGDYAAASALFDKLPEPTRKAAEPFVQSLKARIAADRTVNAIASEAVAQLQKQ